MRKPVGFGSTRIVLAVFVSTVALMAAVVAVRVFRAGPAADDPNLKRHAARVYQERLVGQDYENRDLGLSIKGPDCWKVVLGTRDDGAPAYEGLLVKMEPEEPEDPVTRVRPLVSVVKRTLSPGASRDPVRYIEQHLHAPQKVVVEGPREVTLGGLKAGRVAYEMKSGRGTIRMVQHVHVREGEAIILSAMAPSAAFAGMSDVFDRVLSSFTVQEDRG